jgi:hypothetical protein
MIVESSLSDTVRGVKEIPPEERKIIVYTGVHPHEGTSDLAKLHEERWKDDGVLVVAHPSDNTPHAIWQAHEEICADGVFRPLDYSVNIDETAFEDAITEGEPTLFIRFHGTAIVPNLIQNGYNPDDVAGWALKRRMDPALFEVRGHAHQQAFEEFKKNNPNQWGYTSHLPPDRILLEYNYEGDEFTSDNPFIRKIQKICGERYPNGVSKIFHEDDPEGHYRYGSKKGMNPLYLVQNTLSEDDIRAFHEDHVKLLDDLIAHFSKFYT